MKILGLSPFHDSSATLINDGVIQKYYKEERLNREKRSSFPEASLKKCLDEVDQLDAFAYSAAAHKIIFPSREENFQQFFDLWKSKVQNIVKVSEIIDMSRMHHYQHAASSFYASGFEDAAVVVVDGRGSYFGTIAETETIFYASYPDNFIPVYKAYEKTFSFKDVDVDIERKRLPDCEIKVSSNLGITHLYCTATHLINQSFLENGKTMGLSAYGDKTIDYESLLLHGEALVDPKNFIDLEIDSSVDSIFPITYHKDHVGLQNNVTIDNYQMYANYALHVQIETEKALEILINKAIEKTGSKNVCLAGGYGLNVVNNYSLINKFPQVKFFFDPMSDDSGASIGGAMLSYRNLTKDKKIYPIKNNFIHGVDHDLSKISGTDINIERIAELLLENKIVAMYYGLAEGGPRALGNRSILFNPTVSNGKEIVNKVKKREWYRPFAASMLEEEADRYFEYVDNIGYEYMTINAMAKDVARKELTAVVHEDGSCRIHIVKDNSHPLFKLLTSFKEITGIGVLLNTSFNLAGDPLIETPQEAIGTWKISDIDCLWFPKIQTALIKT
jgi:carbamoyltransferase